MVYGDVLFFFFQAEDGIRDKLVTGFRRVLFRSAVADSRLQRPATWSAWRSARYRGRRTTMTPAACTATEPRGGRSPLVAAHRGLPLGLVVSQVVAVWAVAVSAMAHAAHHEDHHQRAGEQQQDRQVGDDRDAEHGETDHDAPDGKRRSKQALMIHRNLLST